MPYRFQKSDSTQECEDDSSATISSVRRSAPRDLARVAASIDTGLSSRKLVVVSGRPIPGIGAAKPATVKRALATRDRVKFLRRNQWTTYRQTLSRRSRNQQLDISPCEVGIA